MPLTVKQQDIELFKDRKVTRKFTVTQNKLPYDMSTGTVVLKWVGEDGTPVEDTITGIVSGTNNEIVSFEFLGTKTGVVGTYEYKVIHTPAADEIPLFYGNITIINETGITKSLEIYIDDEKPVNLYINPDKRNNRVRYWRNYLQTLIDPNVADDDIDDDTKWPFLVNVLIAKLVVYDCVMLEYKNLAVTAAGATGDETTPSTGDGPIKKIETGPTNVEHYDASTALSNMFKANSSGVTAMDALQADLCMLAHRVRVNLPICKPLSHSPFVPIKAVMDPLEGNTVTDILYRNGISNTPSQG